VGIRRAYGLVDLGIHSLKSHRSRLHHPVAETNWFSLASLVASGGVSAVRRQRKTWPFQTHSRPCVWIAGSGSAIAAANTSAVIGQTPRPRSRERSDREPLSRLTAALLACSPVTTRPASCAVTMTSRLVAQGAHVVSAVTQLRLPTALLPDYLPASIRPIRRRRSEPTGA
jgi:hypothetical protein